MSPRISTFMYAEGAGPIQDTPKSFKLQILNPIQVILLKDIPNQYTFSIIFGIIGLDSTKQHELGVLFKKTDDDTPIFEIQDSQLPVEEKSNAPLSVQGFMFSMGLQNIEFGSSGVYETEVIVDKTSLGKYPIEVIKQERGE